MNERRRQILRKAWRELTGLIIAAIGGIIAIFDASNKWIAGLLVIFGLFLVGYEVFNKYFAYEEKLAAFENSRPIIIPKPRSGIFPANIIGISPSTTSTTTTTTTTITTHNIYDDVNFERINDRPKLVFRSKDKGGKCWFALVDLFNNPIERTDSSVAREVTAHLTYYYEKDCKSRISDTGIAGRWWSNEEVGLSNKPRRELERTDILPGTQPVTLALACMGVKESAIYGYNNDNHENKNFQKPEFSLGLGNYYVHLVLDGIHLRTTEFWFYIWRDTGTGELKVKNSERPTCMKERSNES